MENIPLNYLEFASRGLKDTSRIAASSPQMWNDICLANSKNILKALDKYVELLGQFRNAIIKRDQKSLLNHFTKAQENHSKLI